MTITQKSQPSQIDEQGPYHASYKYDIMDHIHPFKSRIGLGTAGFGDVDFREGSDQRALETSLDLGYRMFDTAEMYGSGRCEILLGKAIQAWSGSRQDLQIVSKVLPDNATSKQSVIDACRRSLDRLQTNYIDVYLLHWRKPETDLPGVVDAFLELKEQGLVLHYGVSNFNADGIRWFKRLEAERGVAQDDPAGARVLQTRYSIVDRLVDRYLLDFISREYSMSVMAHTPLDLGKLFTKASNLSALAQREGCTLAQLALAWQLRRTNLVTIPRSKSPRHQKENLQAINLSLSTHTLEEIDRLFPVPTPEQKA